MIATPSVLLAVADGVSVSQSQHASSYFVLEGIASAWKENPVRKIDGRAARGIYTLLCDRYARGRRLVLRQRQLQRR